MSLLDSLFGKKEPETEVKVNRAELPSDTIISPDTNRGQRIPPGQHETKKWPVLHAGSVPDVDLNTWTFELFGLVDEPWECNWQEFQQLPRVKVYSDFHCVTTWSLLDNLWEGPSAREVVSRVKLKPNLTHVLVHAEHGWTTNMPLDWFLSEDALFAITHNGQSLTPDHGAPMRLVVPRLYAWKSAKWCRGIEFLREDVPGYWEEGGYHMVGDPWAEQRFRWQ